MRRGKGLSSINVRGETIARASPFPDSPKGAAPQSPRLARPRLPWVAGRPVINRNAVVTGGVPRQERPRRNRVAVGSGVAHCPRVARASRPWASRRNPVGIFTGRGGSGTRRASQAGYPVAPEERDVYSNAGQRKTQAPAGRNVAARRTSETSPGQNHDAPPGLGGLFERPLAINITLLRSWRRAAITLTNCQCPRRRRESSEQVRALNP